LLNKKINAEDNIYNLSIVEDAKHLVKSSNKFNDDNFINLIGQDNKYQIKNTN
jgi:hypothetical protein